MLRLITSVVLFLSDVVRDKLIKSFVPNSFFLLRHVSSAVIQFGVKCVKESRIQLIV